MLHAMTKEARVFDFKSWKRPKGHQFVPLIRFCHRCLYIAQLSKYWAHNKEMENRQAPFLWQISIYLKWSFLNNAVANITEYAVDHSAMKKVLRPACLFKGRGRLTISLHLKLKIPWRPKWTLRGLPAFYRVMFKHLHVYEPMGTLLVGSSFRASIFERLDELYRCLKKIYAWDIYQTQGCQTRHSKCSLTFASCPVQSCATCGNPFKAQPLPCAMIGPIVSPLALS